ncbi:MAG: hypothetical protein J6S23_02665 [Clostridia bacterium]|nr:hypothetical protein [Clostridia bacterium]
MNNYNIKHTKGKDIHRAYLMYEKSELCNLSDCYKNPSDGKKRIFQYYREIYYTYNGYQPRIIRKGMLVFSYAFFGRVDNRPAFFYLTIDNNNYIFLDEIDLTKEL